MTKAIRNASCFLLILVALDWGLGTALRSLLARTWTGDVSGEINRIVDEEYDTDILVFGSSRAALHVDAPRIEEVTGASAYNAGSQGRGIYYARLLQALLIDRAAAPGAAPPSRIVLLQAQPSDFYHPRVERAQLFAPYVDENPVVRRVLSSIDRYAPVRLASHLYRYNGLLPSITLALRRGNPGPDPKRGFDPWTRSGAEDPDLLLDEAPAVPDGGSEEPRADVAALYEEFIAAAHQQGQRVLLFGGPRFRHEAPPEGGRELRAIGVLRALAARQGAPYRELGEAELPDMVDPALFGDPNHLNATGAAIFTDRLLDELRALGWLETS